MITENFEQNSRQWPTANAMRQRSGSSQHLSASSFSSVPSSYRSSNNSTFSHTPLRDSMSSSASGYSHTSNMSRHQHFLMAEHLLSACQGKGKQETCCARERLLQNMRLSDQAIPHMQQKAQVLLHQLRKTFCREGGLETP